MLVKGLCYVLLNQLKNLCGFQDADLRLKEWGLKILRGLTNN